MIQTVIDLLNEARLWELAAIDQYMTHHDELKNKDFGRFASKFKEIALAKMKHAEKLAETILSLKGEPISEWGVTSKKGQEIPEMLATDIALERQTIKMYHEAVAICACEKNQTSKDLFEELLNDEEGHLHILETMNGPIDKLGATS
jgi:bacterioferritin